MITRKSTMLSFDVHTIEMLTDLAHIDNSHNKSKIVRELISKAHQDKIDTIQNYLKLNIKQ